MAGMRSKIAWYCGGVALAALAATALFAQGEPPAPEVAEERFNWLGLAAVIGAAAWLPILGQWAYRYFVKPSLDIVIGSTGELGFTTNGTIFNIQAAARVQTKPALITSIQMQLVHTNGRRIDLLWNGLTEDLSQVESTTGDRATYTRSLPAIAVQVIPNTEITQRKITFDDVNLRTRSIDLIGEADARLRRMPGATEPEVVATDEYISLIDHYRNAFPWEAGRYNGNIRVTVAELSDPIVKNFHFTITAANVDHVRSNIQIIETDFRALAMNERDHKAPRFAWVNPVVHAS